MAAEPKSPWEYPGPTRTNTTAAAEVLRKHRLVWYPDGTSGCDCEALYSGSHEQHQADVLAAAGLLADPTTRTEWGARIEVGDRFGNVTPLPSEEAAREWVAFLNQDNNKPLRTLVRRTVTDWTVADATSDEIGVDD